MGCNPTGDDYRIAVVATPRAGCRHRRAVNGAARCAGVLTNALHFLTPGIAALVPGRKLKDYLLFEPLVKRDGFGYVPGGIVAMLLAVPQRPPHFRRAGFRPLPAPVCSGRTLTDQGLGMA